MRCNDGRTNGAFTAGGAPPNSPDDVLQCQKDTCTAGNHQETSRPRGCQEAQLDAGGTTHKLGATMCDSTTSVNDNPNFIHNVYLNALSAMVASNSHETSKRKRDANVQKIKVFRNSYEGGAKVTNEEPNRRMENAPQHPAHMSQPGFLKMYCDFLARTTDLTAPHHDTTDLEGSSANEFAISDFSTEELQSDVVSIASSYSDCGHSDLSEEHSDDDYCVCEDDSRTQKEQALDRLMVCVYDMFAPAAFTTHYGDGDARPSSSNKRRSGVSQRSSQQASKKRKPNEKDNASENDDEEKDESGKRRQGTKERDTIKPKTGKRFACPYFKHDRSARASRACSGPGWDTVHRIKYEPTTCYNGHETANSL